MMKNLIDSDEIPTAVVCASDYIAFGAMKAINEKGLKMPEDISIVGFDDASICNYTTPFTYNVTCTGLWYGTIWC